MDNANSKTHQVGIKGTNEKGIYDMSGNVAEWCSDWYDENYYNKPQASATDPIGPTEGLYKVVRGGGWDCNETFCKVTSRFKYLPTTKKSSVGFRLVRKNIGVKKYSNYKIFFIALKKRKIIMPQKKYILIVLLFIFFSGNIIAQLRMGFTAGTLFTTNTLNHAEIGVINQSIPCFCGVKQVETKPVLLYSAGFTVDYVLSDQFFISTKALFTAKGWNEKTHYADFNSGNAAVVYDSKDKYRLNYFDLPVYFVFSSALGSKDARFNIGFGGYVDFALSGKYQFHFVGFSKYHKQFGRVWS